MEEVRSRAAERRRVRSLLLIGGVGISILIWVLLCRRAETGLPPPASGEWLAYVLMGGLAAFYRPTGTVGLGLGALILPPLLSRGASLASIALAAGAAHVLAEIGVRTMGRRLAPALVDERRLVRSVKSATRTAAAALAAGAVWHLVNTALWWQASAATGIYLATLVTLRLAVKGLYRSVGGWSGAFATTAALGLDGLGWGMGTLLAEWAADQPNRGLAAYGVLTLVIAEAGRHAFLRHVAEHRIGAHRRLQGARRRLHSETSGMEAIARRILAECRGVLPVDWFHFRLAAPEANGEPREWWAGPSGPLLPGRPDPPAAPPTLPGIHRRGQWEIFDKGLTAGDEELARLYLWCDARRIEPGAEELLGSLLPQMASAVHRARLDREARIDPLTQLPVRRQLERRLEAAWRRCQEDGGRMAVILCDIDHFKKINDTFGHLTGDRALAAVAGQLAACAREDDFCARYGGEEFTLLLDEVNGAEALEAAERLRAAVEALDFREGDQPIPLRISLGVAAFPELFATVAQDLLLLADEALYAAKESGRNRALLHLGTHRGEAAFGDVQGLRHGVTASGQVTAPRIFR